MRRLLIAVAVVAVLSGCGVVDTVVNDVKSSTGLLDRTITLYASDGRILKQWKTSNKVEYVGPVAAFIADDGTNVRVSGTFVVEGK